MNTYENEEMQKSILNELLESVGSLQNFISTNEILNLNFDNPSEATISKISREWILFEDECVDFAQRYKNNLDTAMLEMIVKNVKSEISESELITIEKELRKLRRQFEANRIEDLKTTIPIEEKPNKKLKLFISHAKEDYTYIKYFVKLLEDIGLSEENIFCSSFREYGIPMGEDIFEYLKQEFKNNELMVIFMLSENYYRSAASINEMGAAWILQSEYYSVLLPGFDFSKIKGAINPNKISIKLDDKDLKSYLNDFKNKLCKKFKINISDNKWDRVKEDFINKISNESKEKKRTIAEQLSNKSAVIAGIKHILDDEIRTNLKKIASIRNSYEGETFGFLDILNSIDETKFSKEFYQPLIVKLGHRKYDLYEKELILNGTPKAIEVIDLYTQFKIWNEKGDLHNFSIDEYSKLRSIFLREFNKYII